jgi:type I restriction enzyme S subunit
MLGDFIELKRGYDLPQQHRRPGKIPVVSSSGVTDYHDEAIVRAPGVVTGRYGTLGKVFYVEDDFWPLNTTLYVRDFKGNDPRFIRYFLETLNFFAYSDKAAVPGVNRNHLHTARVRMPAVDEQREIAGLLGALDDRANLNEQRSSTLETLARTIFQSWFVDFLPVRAKAAARSEGRDPLRAAMCSLSGKDEVALDAMPRERFERLAATATIFPDQFVENGSRIAPKGWEIGSLRNLCILNSRSWNNKTIPERIDYVDLSNTKDGDVVDVQTMTAETAPSRARRVLLPGDTILGTVRPANRSFALVGATEMALTGSTAFAVLSPHSPEVRELVYLTATSKRAIARLAQLADGAAYPAVRPEAVVDEMLAIPTPEIVSAFHQLVGPMYDLILLNRAMNKTLSALRDALLPKLLYGDIELAKRA